MTTDILHLIHGERRAGGVRAADVFDPSTGRPVGRVRLADPATVAAAVDSAQQAAPEWRAARRR